MSDVVRVSKVNEVFLKVDCDDGLAKELFEFFSFKVPNAKFMPSYRNKWWDGKVRLFSIKTRKIYIGLVNKILNNGNTKNKLVLYRLDKENIFINDNRNITGMTIGLHKDKVELLSIEFYRYLEKSGICNGLLIKDIK